MGEEMEQKIDVLFIEERLEDKLTERFGPEEFSAAKALVFSCGVVTKLYQGFGLFRLNFYF